MGSLLLLFITKGAHAAYMDLQCPALPNINSSAGEKQKERGGMESLCLGNRAAERRGQSGRG